TMLNPYIGHHKGDEIAKEAKKTGKSVIDLVLKQKLMSKADLEKIMKTENMVNPVKLDIKPAKK
ncbi:MAG: aspartate ammonia-lyase, partial [Bacteroidales bacterium]|nr:aspartate ammonia-lyase [Bacteroidales bacterium]